MSNCRGKGLGGLTYAPVTLVVHGRPAPQGSKRHIGGGRLAEVSKNLRPWRVAVARAATALTGPWGDSWVPWDVPIALRMVFTLKRPQRPRAPYPDRVPDLDKLARGTLDALTGILWTDDARVVEFDRLGKVYEGSSDPEALDMHTGVVITMKRRDG